MSYIDSLQEKSQETGSIVCMGMDPVLERIPIDGKDARTTIVEFYSNILDALQSAGALPAIVKPNYAFYAQYGFEGLQALKEVIALYRGAGIPVLLDAKRGDIGKTSLAYAREVFGFWGADAVTISPYLGGDGVRPFTEFCKESRGAYVLARTSNEGAEDFQDLAVDGQTLYMRVAEKIVEWAFENPGVGAVVGATSVGELSEIAKYFAGSGEDVPLLIPGVGAQGGSAKDVVKALSAAGSPMGIHRINSSSGINYAYEKAGAADYAKAAAGAVKKLNKEIKFKP